MDEAPRYCEVALPVPLDRLFWYSLSAPSAKRAHPGCRVQVPFGPRKLVGVVMAVGRKEPDFRVRRVQMVLDQEPTLGPDLLKLGRWIARYYCTPIGEVMRSMLPPPVDIRFKRVVALTAEGEAKARAIVVATGTDTEVLVSLMKKPLTLAYLANRHHGARQAVHRLEERGLVSVQVEVQQRDPTRERGVRLRVSPGDEGDAPDKPDAAERWLLDFLRRNPGRHDLRALTVERRDVVATARRLAKCGAVALEVTRPRRESSLTSEPLVPNPSQEKALEAITAAVRDRRFETFLLHGVTGSGKTEVYLQAIEVALDLGRGALLLVPEIALTPSLASQFFDRFGDLVAVLHSGLTDKHRHDQRQRVLAGLARVVLGTRSAVFAPIRDLGIAIVDEEHDWSYKQSESPRYNGRDVLIVRAQSAGIPVVLGSATPGLESRYNAERGKYTLLQMPTRIMERPLPEVQRVDMRREFTETGHNLLFSRALIQAVRECLARGEQAMILLNRRGFSTYVLCRSCGSRIECPNCSVTLTYHRRDRNLLCHYCDHSSTVPDRCESCGRQYLHFHGSGSEKVEDELGRHFPEASIARLDRDTVRGRDALERILGGFRSGDSNLLVGTQMIAKGHDIPNVTLVCVVDADVGLAWPDFRAAERTFQLLTQVSGRAGRGNKPGRVVMQTMNPDHYAVDLAASQDYEAFYRRECGFRRAFWYPPFSAMAVIVVRSRRLSDAARMSADLADHLLPVRSGMRLLGPASAPMVKLKADYRFQFVLKSAGRNAVAELLGRARRFAVQNRWPATALVLDVDPLDLM